MVPSDSFCDVVCRNSCSIESYLHGSRRLIDLLQYRVQLLGRQGVLDFSAEFVIRDGTYCPSVSAQAAYVVSEIGRRAAQLFSCREHVPEDFTQTYDFTFHYSALLKNLTASTVR